MDKIRHPISLGMWFWQENWDKEENTFLEYIGILWRKNSCFFHDGRAPTIW